MKFLKLTDPEGHRVMINAEHIMVLRNPIEGPSHCATEIVLSSGGFQIVQETMLEVYRSFD
jgi:hypothetical protein